MPISKEKIMQGISEVDSLAANEENAVSVEQADNDLYDSFLSDREKNILEKKMGSSPKTEKPKPVAKPVEEPEEPIKEEADEEPIQEKQEEVEAVQQDGQEPEEVDNGGTDDDEGHKEGVKGKAKVQQDADDRSVQLKKIAELEEAVNDYKVQLQVYNETAKNIKKYLKENPVAGVKVMEEGELLVEKLKPLKEKFGADFVPDPYKVYTPGTPDFEYDQAFKKAQREAIEEEVMANIGVQQHIEKIAKMAVESGNKLKKSLDYVKNNYKIDPDTDETILEAKKFCLENAQNPVVLAARIMELTADSKWGLNNKVKRAKVEDEIEASKREGNLRPSPVSKIGQSKPKPKDKMSMYLSDDD